MRRCRYPILLLILFFALFPRPGAGQESWLDGERGGWNAPGMAIPTAPATFAAESAYCNDLVRPPETAEDAALADKGWRLYSAYRRGWGITLIGGFVDFDAMCRPVPYQLFVFVDGVFAGTLAPAPMGPRTDGALSDAGINAADRLFATYDRYAPTDALCCPSGDAGVMFTVARTATGPVVVPVGEGFAAIAATPVAGTPAAAETTAVCVSPGTGGEGLVVIAWTDEEIAAHEADGGPVGFPHPETGTCTDPAGLPVVPDFLGGFSWVCSQTAAGLWYGPQWTADIYGAVTDLPPHPARGGCPEPRDEAIPPPPVDELAAATAVYLSQLASGDLQTLYAWLHPDAQAAIPEAVVVGWHASEWIPLGAEPIVVSSVELGPWTWGVTGTTYPDAAAIAYEQTFADGTVAGGITYLVQDDNGVWRGFFGHDVAFVDAQIARFAPRG